MEQTALPPDFRSIFEAHEDDADIILDTSDGGWLYVHKLILRKASDTLLGTENCDLPAMPVTEEKAVWDSILRMLYHHEVPDFACVAQMRDILEAARKYDLEFVMKDIEHGLLCPLRKQWDALDVYALACAYGLQSVATQAARATLATSLYQLSTRELHDVPASVFQRLLDYRLRCQDAAAAVAGLSKQGGGNLFKRIDWLPRTTYTFFECNCTSGGVPCSVRLGSDAHSHWGRGYWSSYLESAEQALRERPVGDVVKETAIIVPSLKAAGSCTSCRQHIYEDLTEFAEHMAKEVDRAVAAVSLRL
ncbi:uncharacterized protein PHACADRAFT_194343 [Phanerochaete carnosa HHB-10118-sp]|uniref:BTB domain-containing protein n=1 Tax=Phanerochaete carnosa (strain HHB-10118-sp) TaxID=650164 RepID=K5X1U7_PHACS|nr:uncharacterized protein PHACADRAFT_194343 [Phanerochaete carnosa HHB-10118-sp]EKM56757.1 hypothetical protein PHACADRAFT_194343 [Phanerochaete carnosa HHB-10118-sp]